MKRLLAAMTATVLVATLGSSAAQAGGGNSDKAHLCQKGGYLALSGTGGPFTSEGACVSYAANGGVLNLPVGIVLPSSYTLSTRSHRAGLQNALAAAGYSAQFRTSYDVNSERAEVQALIGQGIKVLVLTSWDSTAAAAAAQDARAAGVKVIAYDRLILNTAAVDYFVTFDGMAVGAAQAQYLIDKAGATTGNNLYLYAGNPADNNSFLFLEGAWERLQPRIAHGTFVIRNSSVAVGLRTNATLSHAQQAAIIDQVTTNWDPDTARTMAAADLTAVPPAYKSTAFILAPNDATARGISDAFAADAAVTTYFVTGQDADQAWVQDLICGTKGMTVFKSPRTLATDTVAATVAFLAHRTPGATATYDNGSIAVPSKVSAIVSVTIDNIQAALIDTGFYEASDFTGTWPGQP
jgi:putative multiple sugar transport system substrate-binding protein